LSKDDIKLYDANIKIAFTVLHISQAKLLSYSKYVYNQV